MFKKRFLLPIIFTISFIIIPIKVVQIVSLFVIFVFFISFLYSRYIFFSIDGVFNQKSYNCKNQEDESVTLQLKNYGKLPSSNFLISIYSNGCFEPDSGVFVCSLNPREILNLNSKIVTTKRGVHKIGPVVISGSDPFNLYPFRKVIDIKSKVVVYPKFRDLDLLLVSGDRGGNQKTDNTTYENLNNLKSIRDYRPGDSIKRINWKATAKAAKPQVMEYTNNFSSPLFIIMDIDPGNYPIKQRYYHIERTIELATSLVITYAYKKNSTSVITKDREGVILENGTVPILEAFSKINLSSGDSNAGSIITTFYEQNIKLPVGVHIYLLISRITEETLERASLLNKNSNTITIVETGGVSKEKHRLKGIHIKYLSPYGGDYLND